MSRQPTAPGWYNDPDDVYSHQAYWDGHKWTGQTRLTPEAIEEPEATAIPSRTTWMGGAGAACGAISFFATVGAVATSSWFWEVIAGASAAVVVVLLVGVGIRYGLAGESKKAWRPSLATSGGFLVAVFVIFIAAAGADSAELSEAGFGLAVVIVGPVLAVGGLCLTAIGIVIGDIYRRVRTRSNNHSRP